MIKPDYNHIRKLLIAHDYDALNKAESETMAWAINQMEEWAKKGHTFSSTMLQSINSLEEIKKRDPKDPLLDFCMRLTKQLMIRYHLSRINDYKSLQVGDTTFYCWKDKGKEYINLVNIVEVYGGGKFKIRYIHHHSPLDGFEHTFKPKNFKFAIRQLCSPLTEKATDKYTFFFFNI